MLERLLGCPSCRGAVERLTREEAYACVACAASFEARGEIASLRLSAGDRVTESVREFYTATPFPNYPPHDSLAHLRRRAARSELARALDEAIPLSAIVLELGCGTGQMSLFLASSGRVVVGADLTRASLELARDAARRYGVASAHFVETDLRAPGLRDGAFDVVYSSGVLHHTPDPRASFAAMAKLVKPGGVVVLGLYNAYARLPHRARRLVARLTGNRVIPFDPVLRDRAAEPERRRAWMRDQYEHPEEHRHTLAEVQRWFRAESIEYLRTYPSTLLGSAPLDGAALFSADEDDWAVENVLAQIAWAKTLGHEGGLFVTIGQRRIEDLRR